VQEKEEAAEEKDTSASTSPVEQEDATKEEDKVAKPNTTGSAFGGFSAFSGKNAFAAFTAPADSNGFGTKASSSMDAGFGGFAVKASGGFEDATKDAGAGSSSGFASFQSKSPVTFASFAAAQPSTDGFGAKASSASSTDFSDVDVKKTEPVVPALTEAEVGEG
jgi:hypothetical protein